MVAPPANNYPGTQPKMAFCQHPVVLPQQPRISPRYRWPHTSFPPENAPASGGKRDSTPDKPGARHEASQAQPRHLLVPRMPPRPGKLQMQLHHPSGRRNVWEHPERGQRGLLNPPAEAPDTSLTPRPAEEHARHELESGRSAPALHPRLPAKAPAPGRRETERVMPRAAGTGAAAGAGSGASAHPLTRQGKATRAGGSLASRRAVGTRVGTSPSGSSCGAAVLG